MSASRVASLIATAAILGGCFGRGNAPPIPEPPQPDPAPALVAYIQSLPRLPYTSSTGVGAKEDTIDDISAITVADPNPNSLYPGSVVQGNSDFANAGALSNYYLAPGGGTVTVSDVHFQDANATSQHHVSTATLGNIQDALSVITHQPFQSDQSGIAYSDITTVYSSHEAHQAISASFSGYGADASAFFAHADDKTENHIIFYFTQSFYSASFTPDRLNAAGYFAQGTSVSDAKSANMNATNPPLVVSSVTYGRRLYVMLSSENSVDQMKASVQAAFQSLLGPHGQVNGSAQTDDVLNSSHMQVLAIGGRASANNAILADFSGSDIAPALTTYIHNGLDYSSAAGPQDAGLPIGYTLSYLQDQSLAKLDSVTHYDPYSAFGPMVTAIVARCVIGSDDKEREDGLWVQINGPTGQIVDFQWVPAHTSDQSLYWDQGTDHSSPVINLPVPIPVSKFNQYSVNFHSEGPDSWRGNFDVYARGDSIDPTNPPNRIAWGQNNDIVVFSDHGDELFLDNNEYDHGGQLSTPQVPQGTFSKMVNAILSGLGLK